MQLDVGKEKNVLVLFKVGWLQENYFSYHRRWKTFSPPKNSCATAGLAVALLAEGAGLRPRRADARQATSKAFAGEHGALTVYLNCIVRL